MVEDLLRMLLAQNGAGHGAEEACDDLRAAALGGDADLVAAVRNVLKPLLVVIVRRALAAKPGALTFQAKIRDLALAAAEPAAGKSCTYGHVGHAVADDLCQRIIQAIRSAHDTVHRLETEQGVTCRRGPG